MGEPPFGGATQAMDIEDDDWETRLGAFGAVGKEAATILTAPEGSEPPTLLYATTRKS